MSELIKITDKKKIFKGRFIKLWETNFVDRNGKNQSWEWIEKANAILVFPITKNGEVVLIKNFRVPLEKYVIEIPAGLNDKGEKNLEDIAKRELMEETGYTADKYIPVPPWPYRAGSSNGIIKAFIATGATKTKDNITGDATEDITVLKVPLEDLTKFYFSLSSDVFFQPEILALYEMAKHLGLARVCREDIQNRWDNYQGLKLVPRDPPDSWKTETVISTPAVPKDSKLIGIPIAELESRYSVKIEVQEGNKEILQVYTPLYISGLGEAVFQFKKDLLTDPDGNSLL